MTIDFESARQKMVDNQIRTVDVTSHSVLTAFLTVEREKFIPANKAALAYIDDEIEIAPGRYVMEPAPLAKLLQLAAIRKSDLVLEVGCGTGYASALISMLADSVVALESNEELAASATATLAASSCDNVAVVTGDLPAGYAKEAPYDVIFVGGSVGSRPEALGAQLREGGRMVAVVGSGGAAQAWLYVRSGGELTGRAVFNLSVKPLPGFEKVPEFQF